MSLASSEIATCWSLGAARAGQTPLKISGAVPIRRVHFHRATGYAKDQEHEELVAMAQEKFHDNLASAKIAFG